MRTVLMFVNALIVVDTWGMATILRVLMFLVNHFYTFISDGYCFFIL